MNLLCIIFESFKTDVLLDKLSNISEKSFNTDLIFEYFDFKGIYLST